MVKTRLDYFKRVRKGEFIKPETAWEKGFYVAWSFKKAYQRCSNKNILIKMLKHLSTVKIPGNTYPYHKRRAKKFSCKKSCWVCKQNRANYYHHIIQLSNGGYNWGFNRIPICECCHKEIHPWLTNKNTKRE